MKLKIRQLPADLGKPSRKFRQLLADEGSQNIKQPEGDKSGFPNYGIQKIMSKEGTSGIPFSGRDSSVISLYALLSSSCH
jgi:hypothetical protein